MLESSNQDQAFWRLLSAGITLCFLGGLLTKTEVNGPFIQGNTTLFLYLR